MKFLLWALLIAAVVLWVLHVRRSATPGEGRDGRRAGDGKQAEPMVQCARCGVHVPVSESVGDQSGRVFCSSEHRRLGCD
ncbi:MAG TPA: PP0621 family protein [Noviherbaspirillum sp.]|nr:PP0621 family protein [Noviherbaspirillum sp.]